MLATGRALVAFFLLLTVIITEECNSDAYENYLEQYPSKCGDDCEEYKK